MGIHFSIYGLPGIIRGFPCTTGEKKTTTDTHGPNRTYFQVNRQKTYADIDKLSERRKNRLTDKQTVSQTNRRTDTEKNLTGKDVMVRDTNRGTDKLTDRYA